MYSYIQYNYAWFNMVEPLIYNPQICKYLSMVEHSVTGANYGTSALLIVLVVRCLLKIVTFSL